MPKPSEIFNTPEATGFSRVRENEEVVEKLQIFKFNREKENGYRMTHDDYIEFFLSILTTKDKEKEEAIRAETHATLTWVNIILGYKHPLEVRQLIEQKLVDLEALPTEDN